MPIYINANTGTLNQLVFLSEIQMGPKNICKIKADLETIDDVVREVPPVQHDHIGCTGRLLLRVPAQASMKPVFILAVISISICLVAPDWADFGLSETGLQ